ncbi:MAG: helix-turn-helix transcriptional regulator [Clostridia bacterium]|nr:helix-turn-helix transcriptional regulator [Clostridia bacterium]
MSDNFIRRSNKREIYVSRIVTVLYLENSSDFVFGGESHDFWEFNYIDKGQMIVTVGGKEYLLKSGELVFFKPNEFHSLEARGLSAPNHTVVSFVSNSDAMKYFKGKIIALNSQERKLLSILLREGLSAYKPINEHPPIMGMEEKENAPIGAVQMTFNLLEEFLITLLRRSESGISIGTRLISPMYDERVPDRIKEVARYMEQNISENLTVLQIAKRFSLSESALKKMFSNDAGCGVTDFFNNMKIEKAKEYIRENEKNFTQISEELGFSSIHYFSRLFKKKTGMTPTEYRSSVIYPSE